MALRLAAHVTFVLKSLLLLRAAATIPTQSCPGEPAHFDSHTDAATFTSEGYGSLLQLDAVVPPLEPADFEPVAIQQATRVLSNSNISVETDQTGHQLWEMAAALDSSGQPKKAMSPTLVKRPPNAHVEPASLRIGPPMFMLLLIVLVQQYLAHGAPSSSVPAAQAACDVKPIADAKPVQSDQPGAGGTQAASTYATPAPASTPKPRLAFLDNVKLLCMASVFLVHSVVYADTTCPPAALESGAVLPPPTLPVAEWQTALKMFLWQYNMCGFAFCSGAVSYCDVTPARLQGVFSGIILPVILGRCWQVFFWEIPTGQHTMGEEIYEGEYNLMTNKEPYYMYTLAILRAALFMLGNLRDHSLMVLFLFLAYVHHSVTNTAEGEDFGDWPILEPVTQLGPYFILGHILVRRRQLLIPYIEFLEAHSGLRICCFFIYVLGWIDIFTTQKVMWGSMWAMGMKGSTLPHWLGQLKYCFFKWTFNSLAILIATAWVPLANLPVLTSAGKYTLYGYLLYYLKPLTYRLWIVVGPRSSPALFWATYLAIQPPYAVLICSDAVRFFYWPFLQPSWFGKNPQTTSLEDVCDVPSVRQIGVKLWLVIWVAAHMALILFLSAFGEIDCGLINAAWR